MFTQIISCSLWAWPLHPGRAMRLVLVNESGRGEICHLQSWPLKPPQAPLFMPALLAGELEAEDPKEDLEGTVVLEDYWTQ